MGLPTPSSLHGRFKIKSPLWSQAWDSILVRLEGRGHYRLCLPRGGGVGLAESAVAPRARLCARSGPGLRNPGRWEPGFLSEFGPESGRKFCRAQGSELLVPHVLCGGSSCGHRPVCLPAWGWGLCRAESEGRCWPGQLGWAGPPAPPCSRGAMRQLASCPWAPRLSSFPRPPHAGPRHSGAFGFQRPWGTAGMGGGGPGPSLQACQIPPQDDPLPFPLTRGLGGPVWRQHRAGEGGLGAGQSVGANLPPTHHPLPSCPQEGLFVQLLPALGRPSPLTKRVYLSALPTQPATSTCWLFPGLWGRAGAPGGSLFYASSLLPASNCGDFWPWEQGTIVVVNKHLRFKI